MQLFAPILLLIFLILLLIGGAKGPPWSPSSLRLWKLHYAMYIGLFLPQKLLQNCPPLYNAFFMKPTVCCTVNFAFFTLKNRFGVRLPAINPINCFLDILLSGVRNKEKKHRFIYKSIFQYPKKKLQPTMHLSDF